MHWSFSSISEENKWCSLYYTGNKPHSCGTLCSLSPSQNRYNSTWRLYPWKHCHNIRQDHLFYLWFFWSCLGFWLLVGYSDILSDVVGFLSFRNKYFEAYKCNVIYFICILMFFMFFIMSHIKLNLRFHFRRFIQIHKITLLIQLLTRILFVWCSEENQLNN